MTHVGYRVGRSFVFGRGLAKRHGILGQHVVSMAINRLLPSDISLQFEKL